MKKIIDPWGSGLVEDYEKIIKDFGLEVFDVGIFPNPNRLMRRGVVFAARDQKIIARCIKEKKRFYVLSGIMPSSEKIHFGNKMVVENIRYFQEQGAYSYVLVADLEAAATRGVSLEEAQKRALDFPIPKYDRNNGLHLEIIKLGKELKKFIRALIQNLRNKECLLLRKKYRCN